jgi:uncharacterized protein YqgC (DUF456 family)
MSDKISARFPRWQTTIGVICIIVGFLALITPLTPGSWLILVGFELLGIRMLLRGRNIK